MLRRAALCLALALFAVPARAEDLREEELRDLFTEFSDLFDPGSVQFRKLRHSELSYLAWCGQFNAKNSFGGYVGWKRFSARDKRRGQPRDPSHFVEFLFEETDGNAEDVRKACAIDQIYHREDW